MGRRDCPIPHSSSSKAQSWWKRSRRRLSWEWAGSLPSFSLPGSSRSFCFTSLQQPRASLPTPSNVWYPFRRPAREGWIKQLQLAAWCSRTYKKKHLLFPKSQGCCESSIQELQPGVQIYTHSNSVGKVYKPSQFFFQESLSTQQFIFTPLGTELWGPFIANGNWRLHVRVRPFIWMELLHNCKSKDRQERENKKITRPQNCKCLWQEIQLKMHSKHYLSIKA